VHLSLAFYLLRILEIVNPVVEGSVRARMAFAVVTPKVNKFPAAGAR
jgi:2-oxoglutarate dehydrogenase complex dehydrogenase (E1) component-like enzyme